jgi:hypothetical protein
VFRALRRLQSCLYEGNWRAILGRLQSRHVFSDLQNAHKKRVNVGLQEHR